MRKKLITMGLVSALGASTSALAVDLDDVTDTPDIIAPDSVVAADATTEDVGYVVDIDVMNTTSIGVGVATGNQIFMRFDLTNAVFDGAVTAGDLTPTGSGTPAVTQGGADEGSFVIFDISTAGAITQADDWDFTPGVAMTFDGAASVTMTVYETLTQAVNQADSLYSISGVFATTTAGVATDTNADSATAEVSTNFTQFAGEVLTASIGDSTFDTTNGTAGTLTPADAAHTVADSLAVATSTVTLSGDVSFGDWYLHSAADCTSGADLDLTEDTDTLDSATATDVTAIEGTTHYVCVDVDGTEAINEGSYTISYGWDTVATAVFPLADTDEAVGAIVRNGTTVQIPYLTVFEDYNQRLVIVNRSSNDAAYTITFTTEDGTTATAGTAATGIIPAEEVLSLKASDIVSTTGTTRTAATLVVVAPSASIDVATNQVNLSDGSTDTVVLN
jgi:hypothetical protein